MARTNDQARPAQARVGAATLLFGFLVIGVSWYLGAQYLIAPEYRLNMAAVAVISSTIPTTPAGISPACGRR